MSLFYLKTAKDMKVIDGGSSSKTYYTIKNSTKTRKGGGGTFYYENEDDSDDLTQQSVYSVTSHKVSGVWRKKMGLVSILNRFPRILILFYAF